MDSLAEHANRKGPNASEPSSDGTSMAGRTSAPSAANVAVRGSVENHRRNRARLGSIRDAHGTTGARETSKGNAYNHLAHRDALIWSAAIGSNERYAAQIDARIDRRVDEMTMRGRLDMLPDQGRELDVQPLTKSPLPVSARAWM